MSVDDVRDLLRKHPFEAFEIITSAGDKHRVEHPEFALVSPSRVVVVDPLSDRMSIISLINITELRGIEPTPRDG